MYMNQSKKGEKSKLFFCDILKKKLGIGYDTSNTSGKRWGW
jgi:hypothetical protein